MKKSLIFSSALVLSLAANVATSFAAEIPAAPEDDIAEVVETVKEEEVVEEEETIEEESKEEESLEEEVVEEEVVEEETVEEESSEEESIEEKELSEEKAVEPKVEEGKVAGKHVLVLQGKPEAPVRVEYGEDNVLSLTSDAKGFIYLDREEGDLATYEGMVKVTFEATEEGEEPHVIHFKLQKQADENLEDLGEDHESNYKGEPATIEEWADRYAPHMKDSELLSKYKETWEALIQLAEDGKFEHKDLSYLKAHLDDGNFQTAEEYDKFLANAVDFVKASHEEDLKVLEGEKDKVNEDEKDKGDKDKESPAATLEASKEEARKILNHLVDEGFMDTVTANDYLGKIVVAESNEEIDKLMYDALASTDQKMDDKKQEDKKVTVETKKSVEEKQADKLPETGEVATGLGLIASFLGLAGVGLVSKRKRQ